MCREIVRGAHDRVEPIVSKPPDLHCGYGYAEPFGSAAMKIGALPGKTGVRFAFGARITIVPREFAAGPSGRFS
jgi:hypothetical protein